MILSLIKREYLLHKAQFLFSHEKYDESMTVLDRLIAMYPKYGVAHLQRAISLMKKDKTEEAEKDAVSSTTLQPGNPAHHLYLGIIRYDLGKFPEAAEAFDAALALSPKNLIARCYKNLCFIATHQHNLDALDALQKDIRYGNTGVQSRCVVYCETFFQRLNTRPEFRNKLFKEQLPLFGLTEHLLSKKNGNLSIAFKKFRIALACLFNPTKRKACLLDLEGDRHLYANEFDAAHESYKHAIDIYPSFDDADYKLIGLYYHNHDFTAVIDHYRQNSDYHVIFDIADGERRFHDLSDTDKASLDPFVLLDLAHAYYLSGDYGKSIILLDIISGQELDYFPDYLLGLCHIALGHERDALRHINLSLQNINPDIAALTMKEFSHKF